MNHVLYDAPGPQAVVRNKIADVVVVAVLVAAIGWIIYRLYESGQFELRRWEQFQYSAIQRQLLEGLWNTLRAAGIAAVLAIVFGAVFASARISGHAWVRVPATVVVETFRAVPMLILMFFFYYGSLQYDLGLSPMWAVVLGLTLYNGSVLAEVFRAGLVAVPAGQREAAYAIGFRKNQVVRTILLPQAVRTMLPAIISQLVILLKDTSLGFIITYNELLYVGRQMGARQEFGFPYIPTYMVIAVVYIGLCGLLTLLANRLEARSRRAVKTARSPLSSDLPANRDTARPDDKIPMGKS
ncbi:amino acid ABC transporter permease [Saccharopolyspora sp. NPDC050389]|uniref:amino acid ABC transporter permease n=1 Tax=Saccharopolyspora sp. NPDC050389 TaxID=3155516 RepID=UPI0033E65E37